MVAAAQNDRMTFEDLLRAAEALPWNDQQRLSPEAVSFLRQTFAAIDFKAHTDLSADDVVSQAHSFWRWGDERQGPTPKVRVRPASFADGRPRPNSLLEIVGADMPFLVGSVVGACREFNLTPALTVHPIVEHGRTETGERQTDGSEARESYIQIVLDSLSETEADALVAEVKLTLQDVRLCVSDFAPLEARMREAAASVRSNGHLNPDERDEAGAFLDWLADGHFTFLGSRLYEFALDDEGQLELEEPHIIDGTSLGVLHDDERFILSRGNEPTAITQEISDFLNEPSPIIVSKADLKSRVHRRVSADYIGVKRYNDAGQVIGEYRFAGLFTADAYNRMTRDVPLIRRKVERAMQAAGARPGSHDANALLHILETYPRDELFQIADKDLLTTSLAILQLQDRTETRLFIRQDRFDRYISALVFVPREAFNSDLRAKIGRLLEGAYDGTLSAFYPTFNDAPLARILFIVQLQPGHPNPDLTELELKIADLSFSWNERMRQLVRSHRRDLPGGVSAQDLIDAFSAGYKDAFSPEETLIDVSVLKSLGSSRPVALRAFREDGDPLSVLRAKVYSLEAPVHLSNSVPVFENMGLFVQAETGHPVRLDNDSTFPAWVHDLKMRTKDMSPIDLAKIKPMFEAAFEAVWSGQTEDDGFNQLVVSVGASWRQAALLRTLSRYRKQTGMDPSQSVQISALVENPGLAELLLALFKVRFDPDLDLSMDEREEQSDELRTKIDEALNEVASLDQDRVLRRLAELISVTLRTTFYQTDPDGHVRSEIAIKIASSELETLPNPKPYREIFVWAPHVEGVHLRFGPVARGGLRWSDRRDDFRTEVLGLVKAQQVKNAVIVPVGSKGGFYPKMLPVGGDREDVRAEAVRAYQSFISSMLHLTDNLVDGEPRSPKRCITWDGSDPYLVVAADKGTATFSDIANAISLDLGFWLGDAFASGGSAGYDHKVMGITARGAWVAVQRHFRELGINTQSDRISVIGVGDMSGDVFGNGMLLSKTIDLKAAFNHLHIFLDPDPVDPEANWQERKRLFDMGRSSWTDYNEELLSKGGAIFSRASKSLTLTPEIQRFIGVEADALTPDELINAILKAKADLLWFGGIGTYVKATGESDLEVGDRINDGLRVTADQLAVSVVGEGANLGVTQAGRIAFARKGGRINTDAVDNSAGVDSSDHEVNIKILLKDAIANGALAEADRNDLLASMTDDVADHVLVHNYDQTGALSVAEASAAADLDSHERMMERLEDAGILDRQVEGLPKSDEIRALREAGNGLSRPELAVLLAYAKITLFDEIIASTVPDDAYLSDELKIYFPPAIRGFETALSQHRLRREIIATRLSNDIINLGGPTFIHRVRERTGASTAKIVRAFVSARAIFDLQSLLNDIDAADNTIPASVQTRMRTDLINTLRRLVFWLVTTDAVRQEISETVSHYRTGVKAQIELAPDHLSTTDLSQLENRIKLYRHEGASPELAERVARVQVLSSATDIVSLSDQAGKPIAMCAHVFTAVGEKLGLDRLRAAALALRLEEHWDRLAVRGLVETLLGQQWRIASHVLKPAEASDEAVSRSAFLTVVDEYLMKCAQQYEQLIELLTEIEHDESWSFAKLVLAVNGFRKFIEDVELED